MKTKITPEYILVMLQELKNSLNDKTFNVKYFTKKYPTYASFRKQLYAKGIIKNKRNVITWISIEPNIIMAKELIKLYLSYAKESQKRYMEAKNEKLLNNVSEKSNILEELELQVDYKKSQKEVLNYEKILKEKEDIIASIESSLTNQEVENESLRQRLKEAEKGIDDNVKKMANTIHRLKEELDLKEREISGLKFRFSFYEQKQDISDNEIKITPKASKTYKLFGIPVFSIINK